MGCGVSMPRDPGEPRRRPGSVGDVVVFLPGLRVPSNVGYSQSLGERLDKSIVERLSALRSRVVTMAMQESAVALKPRRWAAARHGGSSTANLLQALEEYLPVLLGLVNKGSELRHKMQFVWVIQEDGAEELAMADAWYDVLSVQLGLAINSPKATLAVKRRLACELVQDSIPELPLLDGWGRKHLLFVKWKYVEAKAAAYYFHGLILDEGNTEKFHGMAVASLQASEEFLRESKRVSEAFHAAPPTSRSPTPFGTAKYLLDKVPKDASSKVRIYQDLYTQERIIGTPPPLPDFALALQPDDYELPQLDPLWNKEDRHQ